MTQAAALRLPQCRSNLTHWTPHICMLPFQDNTAWRWNYSAGSLNLRRSDREHRFLRSPSAAPAGCQCAKWDLVMQQLVYDAISQHAALAKLSAIWRQRGLTWVEVTRVSFSSHLPGLLVTSKTTDFSTEYCYCISYSNGINLKCSCHK